MKYGLPYKGSKNRLAERITRFLPEGEHLIDLFCGGCAVSHAALLRGKWAHVHINDADWRPPTLFKEILEGKYADEKRWIGREDFFRLKDTDPYVACVWSFGNDMRTYMYSSELEPFKRAIHYAVYFGDGAPLRELGHDPSFLNGIDETRARYSAVRRYFIGENVPRGQVYENVGRADAVTNIGRLRLQHMERRQSLPQCETNKATPRLTMSTLDYAEVEIPEGSVVYCDIPYIGTNVYDKKNKFDYERFYQWAESQAAPIFISSYEMPRDRFDVVAEWAHQSRICATKNYLVQERLFVPKRQKERGGGGPVQLSLFDD